MLSLAAVLATLGFVALASRRIGKAAARWGLPLISGFLLAGLVAGPDVLGLITEEATERLLFVNQVALGFIAFAAGSELVLAALKERLRVIKWITTGLVATTFLLGVGAFLLIADWVPFLAEMPPHGRFGVALLAASILVARSPASAIAIIKELRAKGPFTMTTLGVTVVMDTVVIVLFAISSSVADALLTGFGVNLGMALLVTMEVALAATFGLALAWLIRGVLSLRLPPAMESASVLASGWSVFALSAALRHWSHDTWGTEVLLEPLLICLVAGFMVANFSPYQRRFSRLIHEVGPPVYVAFFTLAGASLSLDVLAQTWPVALVLFGVRLLGIKMGAYWGGVLAGEPMRLNRITWMAYVTQAGVGLGLAEEVAAEFPGWGRDFATVIIAVIVINQILGPLLFKSAIKQAGEAKKKGVGRDLESPMEAVVFGVEPDSLAVARRLHQHGWLVRLADTEQARLGMAGDLEAQAHLVALGEPASYEPLGLEGVDSVVAMFPDDTKNLQVAQAAHAAGVRNLVVPLHSRDMAERFQPLGAHLLDSHEAFVHLVEHYVRTPTATGMLLGMEEGHDTAEVVVADPRWEGVMLRDVNIPSDTIILSLWRNGHHLTVRGTIKFELGDRLTALGSQESLERVAVLFGN